MRYSDDERRRRRARPASVATGGIPAHTLNGEWSVRPHGTLRPRPGPLVLVVMDGVGMGLADEGNAVHLARTPTLDDLVSRRHVKIRRDWSGTHAEDLGSRNGIKINKKKTRKKTLKDRDELEVGGIRLLFIDPTEVREAPVVLSDPEEAATISPGPEEPEAPPSKAKSEPNLPRSGPPPPIR